MGRLKPSKVQQAIRRTWAVIGIATPQQICENVVNPQEALFAIDASGDKRITKIEHIQNAAASELKRRNLIGGAVIAPVEIKGKLSLKENYTIYIDQRWEPYIDEFLQMTLNDQPFDTNILNDLVPADHMRF